MSTSPLATVVAPSVSMSMRSRWMRDPSMTNCAFMFAHIGTKSWIVTVPPLKVAVPWYFGRLPMLMSRLRQTTLHGVS